MSDDLTVSGGGSSAVATAELFGQGRRLTSLNSELASCAARLAAIDRGITAGQLRLADAPISAVVAERHLDDASVAIHWAGVAARMLETSLAASAEGYGLVERQLQHVNQVLAAGLGYGLGFLLPGLALMFAPGLIVGGAGLVAGVALAPESSRREAIAWLRAHNAALSNPQVVQLVRLGVMSADDFGGGLLRIHPDIMRVLGDEGLGLLGLATSAGALIGVGNTLGALAETPVTVRRTSTRTDKSPPASFRDRVDRIPESDAQVRVDRYIEEGKPDRFEVYLGGTKDMAVFASGEPWDMTSNVNALAFGDAGSYRAVEEAMLQAGIGAESPVQFTGHSQGGLVAALLASSGDYNAQGLLTVGGPIGQIAVPESIPFVAIEHTEDLVPALGGTMKGTDAVLVRREIFAGHTVPNDVYFPAHELDRYRETAALLDRSEDGRSGTVLGQFTEFAAGAATVETTLYRATRYRAAQ